MEDSKDRFKRTVMEQETWLAAQPGVQSFHPRTDPECVLEIVARGMPADVRRAIRERFATAKVVFHEGEAMLYGDPG